MNITLVQQNYTVADIEGNCEMVVGAILESTAPIVLFPEGAITGMPLYELSLRIDSALEAIALAAPEKEVFVGLCDFRVAYITGGNVQIIDTNSVEIDGALIQFESDRFYHNAPAEMLRETGCEAARRGGVVIKLNQVGASTDTVYYGGSMVCYPTGEAITLPLWHESKCTIDTSIARDDRSHWGDAVEQTHQALLLSIRDYFSKNGFTEACVALSGGIDSALVVALAVEALGAHNVRVVLLPSAYSSDHSVEDSLDMSRRLGIRHDTIEIEPIFRQALEQLEPLFRGTESGLAEENMQSRIRLMLTMALSNKTGALMLNTSNKSEVAVGYGTLYGDTSGALGIIADLYKGEVYELSNHINRVSGDMIPQNIIDKAPSAELRLGQRDSDSLPEYDLLDEILYRLIEKGMAPEDVIKDGYPEYEVMRSARLLWGGDFKRKQLPPAVRLSPVTLGVEYVMPITKKRL